MKIQKFGKYEVVKKIGEGGFGEVFKGRDPTLKRFVAIKTCKSGSREFLDRFLREAEISARLQHPNIVTIYDFGYQRPGDPGSGLPGEVPYLVQEYLAGEDLDRKIRQRAAMDFAAKVDILRQAAVGLRHAHHRGIVHRDVKPANVRVLDGGGVKIMDFGIAKLLSSEVELTQTGMTLGTARYQAPEQFHGDKIDLRADIFSFGVTAYELLTYERPFDGDSVGRIFYRITHEQHQPIAELWPECPASLEQCVNQCLHKDPTHRYSDLAPVIGVLEAFCAAPGSGSYAAAAPPVPGPPPPPVVAASSGAAESRAESENGLVSRAYDTAVSLQRSRVGRVGAFAAVAVLAFAITYGAGKLWQGGTATTAETAGAGASSLPAAGPSGAPSAGEPSVGEPPSAEPIRQVAITEPAAPVKKPLSDSGEAGTDSDSAVVPEPLRTPSAPPSPPSPPAVRPPPASRPPPPSPEPTTAAAVSEPAAAPEVVIGSPVVTPDPTPEPAEPPPQLPAGVRGTVGRGAVVLYAERNFGGLEESFEADDPTLIGNLIGNDSVRSVQVDAGCRVELYEDADYGGRVTVLTSHRADLRGTEVGHRQVSSVRVSCRELAAPGPGAVLYVHGDFRGPSEHFGGGDPDLADNPVGDDTVSSVRVTPGCRVHLFRKAHFQGKSTVLDTDTASLRETEVGNDEVSSVRVECN